MQTYQLKYPFTTAAGVRLEKVDIRRLTRGDLRKANAYSKDDFDQENFMLASMCGVTAEDLEGFDLADSKALADLFGPWWMERANLPTHDEACCIGCVFNHLKSISW